MKRAQRLAERIRAGQPLPLPLDWLLRAAAPLYQAGMWRRRRLPVLRVPAHVVSFGNITAGGAGKTPAVIARAIAEIDLGARTAVLTRGYGSPPARTPQVLSQIHDLPAAAAAFGDEPALIARNAPGVHVVKCNDRAAAARHAVEVLGCKVLLLDDGFQFIQLARDEDIVLVDARDPFGNECLLPRGILREPLHALQRATEIWLTRCDQAQDLDALRTRLNALAPGVPLRAFRHAPRDLWEPATGAVWPIGALDGRNAVAACAIASPSAFFQTLEALGANLIARHAHPDHAPFDLPLAPKDAWIVVTEKDAVRLENPPPGVLALRIQIEPWP